MTTEGARHPARNRLAGVQRRKDVVSPANPLVKKTSSEKNSAPPPSSRHTSPALGEGGQQLEELEGVALPVGILRVLPFLLSSLSKNLQN